PSPRSKAISARPAPFCTAGSARRPEMTPERYQQLCELFDEAEQRPPAERAQFVHRVWAEDPSLGAELEKLLSHDRRAWTENLFQEPCAVNAKALLAADAPN